MARGAAQARKRAKQQTRKRRPSGGGGRATPVEQQLFFTRLRKTQKPVFIFLALAFAIGFVFFGVGSGSTGIADALGNFTHLFGSSGSSTSSAVSKARKRVHKHPNAAAAWHSLATAYQQEGNDGAATRALEHYTRLNPRDDAALLQIATYYTGRGQQLAEQWRSATAEADTQSAFFNPVGAPSSGLAQAFSQDPIGQAFTADADKFRQRAVDELRRAATAQASLTKLKPKDQFTWFQLGDTEASLFILGQNPADRTSAVRAYRRGIKIAPKTQLASQAKSVIYQLTLGLGG